MKRKKRIKKKNDKNRNDGSMTEDSLINGGMSEMSEIKVESTSKKVEKIRNKNLNRIVKRRNQVKQIKNTKILNFDFVYV